MGRRVVAGLALSALVGLTGCRDSSTQRVALTRGVVRQTTPTWASTPTPQPAPAPAPVAAPAPQAAGGRGGGGGSTPVRINRCGSVDVNHGPALAAAATGASTPIYASPGDAQPIRALASPNSLGFPQHFLVKARQGDWLGVLLPMRPNQATGWIRASDVSLTEVPYRIVVQQGAHLITVYQGSNVILQEPIGLGRAGTATPCGEYFLTELLQPTNGGGAYGPYAFGTSAYSEVLTSFAGGNGQIGLHGTNQPELLGRNVSHGCIRMSNSGITKLAQTLPLGTPLYITS